MKFSANGNFTNHKENLTEKTERSFFVARCYLDFLTLPIHIINKLFNTLFPPILTYCSEVWGIYDKSDYSRWDEDSIEKTHIHFCEMCLGFVVTKTRNDLQWSTMTYNDLQWQRWSTMTYNNDLQWPTMIYNDLQWPNEGTWKYA